MRSSSLKVYSPVEYTGYKEKRSGHPSEPGSRTGNRKTTRKPKPILYRLRRFCKRLNWKGIGGLAVTTVVIVFAVRGVVGMFSEHTQTKTAPITTSSPAAEESQPYVFYYKDGQAVSWEDVTDAWAAEAGIQKRYALTDAERLEPPGTDSGSPRSRAGRVRLRDRGNDRADQILLRSRSHGQRVARVPDLCNDH